MTPDENAIQTATEIQGNTQAVPGSGVESQAAQAAAQTFTQEQVDKFAGKAREEGRKSAEKNLMEKLNLKTMDELMSIVDAYRKSEAEKLSEVEKTKKELDDLRAKMTTIEKENQLLKMRQAFDVSVRELNLEFANDKAANDAFQLIDHSTAADESKGMKVAVKQLWEERSYLFKKADIPAMDATKKGISANGKLSDDKIAEIKRKFRIR